MCQPSAGSGALALREPRYSAAAGKTRDAQGWLGLRQAGSMPQQPVGDNWDASGKPKHATPVLTAAASLALMPERYQPQPPGSHSQPCR